MKTALSIVTLAGALLCTGCQDSWLSLYPLYEKGDTVLDAGLAGPWYANVLEPERIVFSMGADSYVMTESTLTAGQWKESEHYDAFLTRIGDSLFLDLSTSPGMAIRGHSLLKIRIAEHALQITSLRDEWLREQLMKQAALSYLDLPDGRQLITAPTRELRRFIVKYADDSNAFEDELIEFHRRSQ